MTNAPERLRFPRRRTVDDTPDMGAASQNRFHGAPNPDSTEHLAQLGRTSARMQPGQLRDAGTDQGTVLSVAAKRAAHGKECVMDARPNTLFTHFPNRSISDPTFEPANELEAALLDLTGQPAADFGVSVDRLNQLFNEFGQFASLVVTMSTVDLGTRCPECGRRKNRCRVIDPRRAEHLYERTVEGLMRAALSYPEVAANLWVLFDPDALAGFADFSDSETRDVVNTVDRHATRLGVLASEGIEFERFDDGWIVHLNPCRCSR